jgi:transcriptional regulator with XRE-family HTH domain
MNRKQFGQIIATLRKSQFDLITGKSWSQQVLADKIGVSDRLIAALEQGAKSYFEPEILGKLASAFSLTTMERREFFALAVGIEGEDLTLHPHLPTTILTPLIEALGALQQPAYLYDGMFDVIALNAAMKAFLGLVDLPMAQARTDANCLAGLFAAASPTRSLLQQHWQTTALYKVYHFRALSLRYRHTDYFKGLFQQLCRLPNFSTMWMQTQHEKLDFYSHIQVNAYRHAALGAIKYLVTRTTTVTPYGNLYLATLAPANGQTVSAFSTLAEQQGIIRPLVTWPNPELYC